MIYRALLAQTEPERSLFLGVSTRVYDSVFSEPLGQLVVILAFDWHEPSHGRRISRRSIRRIWPGVTP